MKSLLSILLALLMVPVFGQENDKLELKSILGQLRARQIGPAVMSGRVIDLEIHPEDGNIFYVGSAGGGVWKTIDGGVTFNPIFDDHIQSIGSIALDPNAPDKNIWVGTGEIWTRNSVSIGDGLYKSTDGGKKWDKVGFEDSERISSIKINPNNSDEVYVSVLGPLWGDYDKRGVFKSSDGGETWDHILKGDASTGISDLFMDPNDPDVLYAALWEFRRTAWSFNSGGEKSALYKSTDGGKNWEKIHNGFPEGKLGRIAVALAPSNSNILYTVLETEKNEDKGLYRSIDGGANWEQVNNDFEITVRPFYFSRIVVSPHDENVIAKAGLFGSISKDGGKTFRPIQSSVHSDIHDFVFSPTDKNRIYLGSDGGVYRSYDGGNIWAMSKGLPLSQYYHVTVDNDVPYNVYGGLQDNGSWIGTSSAPGGIDASQWRPVGFGDGFRVYPHPEDNNIVYSEMQGAENIWRVNIDRGESKIVKPYPEKDDPKLRFNWNAPFVTGLHDPDVLYVGSQFLHKSIDRGETWTKISSDLTTDEKQKQNQAQSGGLSTDNSGAENHCTIFTIGESPLNKDIIWVGTDDGNVQITKNGGENWTNVTRNIPGLPKNTWVYHIEPSVFDELTAYAVFDGHTKNDMNPYVYKTTDGGQTWKSIVTDEIGSFARSIQEDTENPNLLFLGTEIGLYITLDGGLSWTHFKNNMPPVAIHHLTLQTRENDLVMGTHGRGIIILDDISILRQVNKEMLSEKVYFFEKAPAIMNEGGTFQMFRAMGDYIGENPTSQAEIVYYLNKRHTFGKMKVEVLDDKGEVIADLTPGKSKGINIVRWNYRHKMPKIAEGKTFTFGGFTTPMVPPGEYKVRMTKGKEVFESSVEIMADPQSVHSEEDRKAGYEAAMRLYNMNEQLASIIDQVDAIKEGTSDLKKEEKLNKKLKELIGNLDKDMTKMKKPLVVMTGDNYVGAAEPQLREKIASLYSDVAGYAGKPSNSQIQNIEYLDADLQEVQSEMYQKIEEVNQINKLLEKKGLPTITLRSMEDFKRA